MLRTALLGGNTINLDADLSKYIETVSDQGVIEGLEVNSNSVAPGKAWVKATRSNGETIMTLVQNTEALVVDTSGTKKIWLEIRQEAIDNGLLNNEDGTGIASIKTGPSVPSQNFLLLASVADGVVKDKRNLIPKIQSVAQKTSTLEEKVVSIEGGLSSSALTKDIIVGEKILSSSMVGVQFLPKADDCTIGYEIGKSQNNSVLHIQRFASEHKSNLLKVKIRKFGSPTTKLVFSVQKGVLKNVSSSEDAWVGDGTILATGEINYNNIDHDWKEFDVVLNGEIGGKDNQNDMINIVVHQENRIVNNSNYYEIACDSSQYSEALRLTTDNGSNFFGYTKFMPYCNSVAFLPHILGRKEDAPWVGNAINERSQLVYGSTIDAYGSTTYTPTLSIRTNVLRYRFKTTNKNRLQTSMKVGSQYIFTNQYLSDHSGIANKSISDNVVFSGYKDSGGSNVTFKTEFVFYWLIQENISLIKKNMLDVAIDKSKDYNVGEVAKCTIHGFLPDGSFFGKNFMFDGKIDNVATTGSIPPVNAVGYITIQDKNGQKYKLRVYGV